MRAGKSLQVIAFLHTLFSLPEGGAAPLETDSRVLLVAPKNVLTNWQDQFAEWLAKVPPGGHLSLNKVWSCTCVTHCCLCS